MKSEITSNYIYVECKNYSGKVSNPEFDQLSGRYNESSSKVGFLVCRKISDINKAYERVSAQFRRKKDLSLIITDETIHSMLNAMKIRDNKSFVDLSHENILYDIKRKIEVEKY